VSEPFRIRDAVEADVAQITAIYADEVRHGVATFEEMVPTEEDMADRLANIQRLALPYLVAERAGVVLGYAYAGQFHPRAAYRYTLEDTVYIHRDARRQGAAKALLEKLIVRCEALGARQMMALITSVPDSASVALHQELGYRCMGVAPAVGFKFGRWLDVAYLQRPLGAADTTPPDRQVLGPSATGMVDA
jgi:L-amino acid N-acyltransferase YncA